MYKLYINIYCNKHLLSTFLLILLMSDVSSGWILNLFGANSLI